MAAELDFDHRLAETVDRIDDAADIDPENKDLLLDFKRDRKLDGIKPPTIERDLSALKVQAEHASQPFDEMAIDDIKDLVEYIHNRYENDYTRSIHKRALRNLFKWLNGGEHPDETEWIQTYVRKSNGGKLPEELLTKEDIKAQVEAAYNKRDKALIWMLYETGARIGELIDLTVGAIEDRKNGKKKVVIDGKTGSRRLPLVESVPALNRWLNEHPNPEKDAPLWCKIQQGGADDQLGYRYIRDKILRKHMEKAGIDKPSNPHHYRHSRASHLANHMTEAQLCAWFGWVQGSDVPAKYVHLSGRDIDHAYDAMHGLADPEEDEEEDTVVECWRCEDLNEADRRYCGKCGAPLNEDAETVAEQADRDVKSGYAETESGSEMQAGVQSIDDVLDDYPEAKQALYEALAGGE